MIASLVSWLLDVMIDFQMRGMEALVADVLGLHFFAQTRDFLLNGFVLDLLAPEEGNGNAGLFLYTGRGQQIGISQFFVIAPKILEFDESFRNQRFQAVVGFPKANAHFTGEFALADIRIGFDQFEKSVLGVVAHWQRPFND